MRPRTRSSMSTPPSAIRKALIFALLSVALACISIFEAASQIGKMAPDVFVRVDPYHLAGRRLGIAGVSRRPAGP